MTNQARILVATDSVADGELVQKLLHQEFDDVVVSNRPDRAVSDFEQFKPQVLVLGFDTLEKSESYYLGLYRLGTTVPAIPHRTVILCGKDDLRRVYELCKKAYFDDYVLFWPMTHDAPRLPMAIIHALRRLENGCVGSNRPTVEQFAIQARRVAELEDQLADYVDRGSRYVQHAAASMSEAREGISHALDRFSARLTDGDLQNLVEIKDRGGFAQEVERLHREDMARKFQAVADVIGPMTEWVDNYQEHFSAQIDAARSLGGLADRIKPLILAVDDDPLQRKLLAQLLNGLPVEVAFSASGTEAFSFLRQKRPDLVLMDVNLTDISGIETTKRLKAIPAFSDLPVIMVTGNSEKAVVIDSLRAGAADFVVKPLDRVIFLAKITSILSINA